MPNEDLKFKAVDAKGKPLRPILYKELDLNLPWDSFDLAHELTTKDTQKFVADYQSPDLAAHSAKAHSSFTDISSRLPNRTPSPPGCDYCSVTTGSSTPNGLSGGQNMCCAISAHTPAASPSPTTDWLLSPTATSPSAGEIPLTATRSGS